MMENNLFFEGSETFFADVESDVNADENILNAVWVSQR
jgi:hypothetical protein